MKRILVIDDEEMIQRTVRRFLESLGYAVETVGSGHKALELMERESYDLFICDFKMPEMSGKELIRKIKEKSAANKIIVITGSISPESVMYIKQLGITDFLIKPFDLDDFEAVVKKYVG